MTPQEAFTNHLITQSKFLPEILKKFHIAINQLGRIILEHRTDWLMADSDCEELLDFIDGNGFEVDWNTKHYNNCISFRIIFKEEIVTINATITTYTAGEEYHDIPIAVPIQNPSRRIKGAYKKYITVTRYDEIDQPP